MLHPEERRILSHLGGPMVAAERDGHIAFMSNEAAELLRYDADEVVGLPLTTLVPARLVRQHHAGFQRYLRTGQSRLLGKAIEVPAVRGDGTEMQIKLSILMFRRPDGTDLIVGSLLSAEDAARLETVHLEDALLNRAYALV